MAVVKYKAYEAEDLDVMTWDEDRGIWVRTPSSLLTAGLLDGLDSSSFASATHTHTVDQIDGFDDEIATRTSRFAESNQSLYTSSAVSFASVNLGTAGYLVGKEIFLWDSNNSHVLGLVTTSNLTANRALSFAPGDADRVVTISGNTTISQDYSTTGSPTFNALSVTSLTLGASGGTNPVFTESSDNLALALASGKSFVVSGVVASNVAVASQDVTNTGFYLSFVPTPASITASRTLQFNTGNSDRTLTISGNATISQDYSTAGSPTFTGLNVTTATIGAAGGTNPVFSESSDNLILTMGTTSNFLLSNGPIGSSLGLFVTDADDSHTVSLICGENNSSNSIISLQPGSGTTRVVTIAGDTTISQDYSTSGSPTFNGLTLTSLTLGGSAVTYGTYTPTLANTTNVAASTAYSCQYIRVGSIVHVSGRADVDPTTTGTTVLSITLPVASNLANTNELAGTAFCPAIAGQGAAVYANTAGDTAYMQWVAVDTTNQPMFFTFTYRII